MYQLETCAKNKGKAKGRPGHLPAGFLSWFLIFCGGFLATTVIHPKIRKLQQLAKDGQIGNWIIPVAGKTAGNYSR